MTPKGISLKAPHLFVLLLLGFLQLSVARKTSANQVPLGISRATGHAKAARLAGPRITPIHRLAEQEKLKKKVFKQVAWKEKMLEEKLSRIRQQEEQVSLTQKLADSQVTLTDKAIDTISEALVSREKNSIEKDLQTAKRRPLLRKFLLKRKIVE